MAMSVVYTTINGQIVHENRGGVEAFYAPDTLGSTVALLSTTGSVTDTYTYQPYGEIVSHVGSSVTPFTFVGTLGYYLDVSGSLIYVRARYLRQALTRWQTVDPFWPDEQAYGYCSDAPAKHTDPSGLAAIVYPAPPPGITAAQWNAIIAELTALGLATAEIILVLLAIIAIGLAIGFGCAQLRKQRYKACPSKSSGNPTDLRGCTTGMSCLETLRLLHGWADCLASQIAIDFICYGGAGHGAATSTYVNNAANCAKKAVDNCAGVHNIIHFCWGF